MRQGSLFATHPSLKDIFSSYIPASARCSMMNPICLKELQHGLVVHKHLNNKTVQSAPSGWKFCAVDVKNSERADQNAAITRFAAPGVSCCRPKWV